jgi:hypothetical protein
MDADTGRQVGPPFRHTQPRFWLWRCGVKTEKRRSAAEGSLDAVVTEPQNPPGEKGKPQHS